MKGKFGKISGKKIQSKVIKTGLIVATVGTIIFGVMFGEQIYESTEDVYMNSKAKAVSVYQDVKTSVQQSLDERATKIELRRQEKAEKIKAENKKNASIKPDETANISLGYIDVEKILTSELISNNEMKNNTLEKVNGKKPASFKTLTAEENITGSMAGISLGAVESAGNPIAQDENKESNADTSNETAEKKVVGTKTQTFKSNNIRMGQVVSQNITKVVTSVYSDGTESQERTTSLSYDLNDETPSSQLDETKTVSPEVAKEETLKATPATLQSGTSIDSAEKKIVGTKTFSTKETNYSMGQVVSKNVDSVVKDVYSDGTESQARKSNFSFDMKDEAKTQPVQNPTVTHEVTEEVAPATLQPNSAVVTIENKSVVTAQNEGKKVKEISIKETTYSKREIVNQTITRVSTDLCVDGIESQAVFTTSSSETGNAKVESQKIEALEKIKEQNEESNNDNGFYLDTFDKPYSLEEFCADYFKNKILEDYVKKSNKNIILKYIDLKGKQTFGTINSTQLHTIYDTFRNSPNSVFCFGGKTFSFDINGNLLDTEKENDNVNNYIDDTNFKLGVNILGANLKGINPTPTNSATASPNILLSGGLNLYNSENTRLYYDFKTGYYFPISKDIQSSISTKIFGAKDFSNNFAVFGGSLQGDTKFYEKNGIYSLSGGVGYTSNNSLYGSFGVQYDKLTSNNNLVGVFAGINALHNTLNHHNSFALSMGASIKFGGNSKNKVSTEDSRDMYQNYALNYDLANKIKQPQNTQNGNNGQNPINPNGPTINPPFDDGLGGIEPENGPTQNPSNPNGPTIIVPYDDGRGMEQGQ